VCPVKKSKIGAGLEDVLLFENPLVNCYKTNWEITRYFDWAIFNSFLYVVCINCCRSPRVRPEKTTTYKDLDINSSVLTAQRPADSGTQVATQCGSRNTGDGQLYKLGANDSDSKKDRTVSKISNSANSLKLTWGNMNNINKKLMHKKWPTATVFATMRWLWLYHCLHK
jgi:hypothetical protein